MIARTRMRAIRVARFGGPEVLEVVDEPAPVAADGQRLVTVKAAAVNASDLLARAGLYTGGPVPPFFAGIEGAGVDEQGRRVAFLAHGAQAETVAVDDDACVELPDDVSFEQGAGFLVSYLTAFHALATAARVQPGDRVLVHAAAGAFGSAAVQIARELGARVVGTASTSDKRARVAALGAEARDYADLAGLAPDVVVDPVGGRVTGASLRLLPPFGRLVLVGMASGEPTPIDAAGLVHRSLCVHGVHLSAVLADAGLVRRALAILLPWLERGRIAIQVGHVLPLARVADAHALLASRASWGKIVLVP
jgi:NADPH:quinone reductase